MNARQAVARVPPGALGPHLWALAPAVLTFRGATFAVNAQPALVSAVPEAVVWLALEAEDLVLLGPYGDAEGFAPLVAAAREAAAETGRGRLVAAVRNDEVERFECLQRLGFVLVEARVGVFAAGDVTARAEARLWGDIAARDELVFALAVGPH